MQLKFSLSFHLRQKITRSQTSTVQYLQKNLHVRVQSHSPKCHVHTIYAYGPPAVVHGARRQTVFKEERRGGKPMSYSFFSSFQMRWSSTTHHCEAARRANPTF